MNDREIMVSVVCLAYNHAKYIRKTLESFVSQKTDFAYEVIIHDDASTDETAAIIKEYSERYPDVIVPILQKENQHSQKKPIHRSFTAPIVKGRYVAMCEGDDFWTDDTKLQRQFEIMESHPECSICVHKICEVLEDGTETSVYHPSMHVDEGAVDTAQFLKIQRKYPFQTGSFFMRAEFWKQYLNDPPEFRKASDVGDEPMLLYMLTRGMIYYIDRTMGAYRVFSVGSWSSKNKNDPAKRLNHAKRMYEMMRLYDEYTDHKYDCGVDIRRGTVLWLSEDYRALIKRENKRYLKQMSISRRIYVYICAAFPFVSKLRRSLRQGLRRKNERK